MHPGSETIVDLIRHGEPVGGRKYRGQIDDPLSERGWQQMWDAVGGHTPWGRIITSPLVRCRAFAEALAERHHLPLSEDTRFQEVGFGAWEGKTGAELRAEDPDQLRRFYADPVRARPPGAEPLEAFLARVAEALDELMQRHRGEHVLVVAHAGVIRAAITHVLEGPPAALYRIHVDNASMTRIRADQERPATVVFHGAHHC
jgi:alpha-ribazole phosphatase/probable phosphoglycerate mutase